MCLGMFFCGILRIFQDFYMHLCFEVICGVLIMFWEYFVICWCDSGCFGVLRVL